MPYHWTLSILIEYSYNVNNFKINQEYFKKDCIKKGIYGNNHCLKVSDVSRIEGDDYLENKSHPCVAKRKFINLN